MSMIASHHLPLVPRLGTLLLTRWMEHRQRKAERAALEQLLARSDVHLLDDIGLDRAAAHRLIGETMVVPHRAWDRWQL